MGCEVMCLEDLIKRFLCCTPINTLNQMIFERNFDDFSVDVESQKKILESTVGSDLIKRYPIKYSYQKAFLKWLMSKIEEKGDEIHDDIYSTYCNLLSLTSNEPVHFRHFLIDNGTLDCITVQESTNMISEGTTGLCSWQGAIGLSEWCMENKTEFNEKIVLELGCGVGLTGLNVIGTCSPKKYIFSDCHQAVLAMVTKNILLNLSNCEQEAPIEPWLANSGLQLHIKYKDTIVEVMKLKWEDIGKYITEQSAIPDIIIGADIIYEKNSFYALVTGLKAFLTFDHRYAIIAATIRNEDTMKEFLDELGVHKLMYEECIVPEQTICIQLLNSPVRILKIFQKR